MSPQPRAIVSLQFADRHASPREYTLTLARIQCFIAAAKELVFRRAAQRLGVDLPGRDIVNERKLKLASLAEEGDRLFEYVYDDGDNWCGAIVIEALQPALSGIVYPRLVEGARRGPPEDIGGPPGLRGVPRSNRRSKHERHAELTERSGDCFDPEGLSIDDVNLCATRKAEENAIEKGSSSFSELV